MDDLDEEYKKNLIERYIAGEATEKELEAFFSLISRDELNVLLEASMDREITLEHEYTVGKEAKQTNWFKYVAAAASLIIVSLSVFLFKPKPILQTAQNQPRDLAPGREQATLTLSGGRKIMLSSQLQGRIATQGNTQVQVQKGGALRYIPTGKTEIKIANNTLTTARGEESPYCLVLADGTKVWLNAASSITFPSAFNSVNHQVSITGEVYFEVVHDPQRAPLQIIAEGQVIEDIGTRFDINAYADEPVVKTTVLEGSVKLSAGPNHKMIAAGQQGQVKSGDITLIPNADMGLAIAWHKGLFQFDNATIPEVMRQLSRWYNVDISYAGVVPEQHFSGKIYRNMSALKASDILSYSGIHFRIEGKEIIVEP
jgi:transmembrane sensor